jgi:hypothetical protein
VAQRSDPVNDVAHIWAMFAQKLVSMEAGAKKNDNAKQTSGD